MSTTDKTQGRGMPCVSQQLHPSGAALSSHEHGPILKNKLFLPNHFSLTLHMYTLIRIKLEQYTH